MNVLIPCSHCERYVRSHESACPFCHGTLSPQEARPVARALVRSPSRAAAFALRTALVVAPAGLACGGEAAVQRAPEGERMAAGSGGAGSNGAPGGSGGSVADQGGGVAAGGPVFGDSVSDSSAGSDGALALDADADADAGVADAAYVPVPIYGGVFPDPVTRARV